MKEKLVKLPSNTHIKSYSDDVRKLIEASLSQETRRTYASSLRMFFDYLREEYDYDNSLPIPTQYLAEYFSKRVKYGHSIASIEQLLAALSLLYRRQGLTTPRQDPVIKQLLKGIRHTYGTPAAKKAPIRIAVLERILSSIDRNTLRGKRDAALFLVGFAGAFRRSELSNLNMEDIMEVTSKSGLPALEITIKRSKTDQEGHGLIKAIFTAKDKKLCPIEALHDYLQSAKITHGAVFRRIYKSENTLGERLSGHSICNIVKHRGASAGVYMDLGGHSLRSGFVTSAIEAGKQERSIQNQTGHRSTAVLRGYYQRDSVLSDNAADDLL